MKTVAVIGSGVAGALTALKLAEAGKSVTLIEAGPRVSRAQAAQAFAAELDPDRVYPRGPDQPLWGDQHNFYVQKGPELLALVYDKLVGGSTWHWLGTCLRLLPSDFRMRTRYGVGCDWPLSYAELEPFYSQAEAELGVSGKGAFGSPRSRPYPMPPLPATYLDKQVGRAARQRGYAVSVLPAARNSEEYQGRPACHGNATCVPICPIGAKYDAGVHVARAEAAGVRLLINTQVEGLEWKGDRILALQARAPEGPLRLEADAFVLAANTVESTRLLLRSQLGGPALGRYLMGMAGQISWALAPRPVWPFRSPQVVSGITQFREGDFRRRQAAFLTSIGNDGWPQGAPPDLAQVLIEEGLMGTELRKALLDHVSRQVLLVSNCEELPFVENRIVLAAALDARGLPRPQIHYRIGRYTQAAIEQCVLVHARIFDEMGASQIHHVEDSLDPAHAAGTCRMGDSAADSVVDRNLACHQQPNLFVVGSAVFPTVGSAPPTLTVAALALRCAAHLATLG